MLQGASCRVNYFYLVTFVFYLNSSTFSFLLSPFSLFSVFQPEVNISVINKVAGIIA